MGGKGKKVFRNKYKGHMDKVKGVGVEAGEGGRDDWGWGKLWGVNADNCN